MGCGKSGTSTQVIPHFVWGLAGKVQIKTIKLVLQFDPSTRSIVKKVPNDRMTESLLKWSNRVFTLQDLSITDFSLNKTFNCPPHVASFSINEYDEFNDLVNPESLINTILETQGKQIETVKIHSLQNSLKKDCKDLWDFMKHFWVKNKNIAEKRDVKSFGVDCVNYSVEKQCSVEKIRKYLSEKFGADGFGKIKRDVKAKAVLQKNDLRPHIVKVRRSSFIQVSIGTQDVIDIKEEVRIMIFCWDDLPQIALPSVLEKERVSMNKSIKVVFEDFQKAIDMI